jgi:hypothetical protein
LPYPVTFQMDDVERRRRLTTFFRVGAYVYLGVDPYPPFSAAEDDGYVSGLRIRGHGNGLGVARALRLA